MRACVWFAVAAAACGADPTPLPCDVDAVLEAECRLCHGDPTAFGAPMPLVTWEHTQDRAPTDESRLVWEVMEERVHSAQRPMPPRSIGELTAEQLAVLDAWFAAGAPPGDAACP